MMEEGIDVTGIPGPNTMLGLSIKPIKKHKG